MAKSILTNINLNNNELQNVRIQNVATLPATGVAGKIVYLTTDNELYKHNGTEWVKIGTGDVAWANITGKPTTVSGYGITDAYTKTEVDGLLDDKADASDLTALEGRVDTAESDIDDLETGKIDKVASATANDIAKLNADGSLADSGVAIGNVLVKANVINDVTHTDTDKPLSANMGKDLSDRLTNVESRGRYLSLWNCTTGLPETEPSVSPYAYKTGDYYIVGTVGATNYKPDGSSYTTGTASTVVETNVVAVNDTYIYDGTVWKLQANVQREVTFASIAGQPTDNTNLAGALNAKADTSALTAHTTNTSNPHSVTKAQVGLGDVDNKSEATIKSDFTGSVASGNTGFVTGGDVFTALGGKSKINLTTGSIQVGATSATINFTGTYIATIVKDANNEEVICDVSVGASSVVVSIATAPTQASGVLNISVISYS